MMNVRIGFLAVLISGSSAVHASTFDLRDAEYSFGDTSLSANLAALHQITTGANVGGSNVAYQVSNIYSFDYRLTGDPSDTYFVSGSNFDFTNLLASASTKTYVFGAPYSGNLAFINQGFGTSSIGGIPGESTLFISNVSTSPLAAVPEPETYALLLAGLGVMGAVARRRNKPGPSQGVAA